MDTQVLIAGAGPTGLTLAVDLGMRGVRCTLIEQKEAPQFLPKMERCNARTHGNLPAHGAGRQASAPPACRRDVPMDVFIVLTNVVEPPLLHKKYPSVTEAEGGDRGDPRRHAAARALPADLAIHARAVPEVGGGDAAERHACATAMNCCRSARTPTA